MITFKTNWREKTLYDFEVADSLNDQVLPPQQAIRLMTPLWRLSVFFKFGALKEVDWTVTFNTHPLISNRWSKTVKLSHQTDLRLEIIFNFHNVVIVWINGRIQRVTLRQRPGRTWGGFFLLLHWSLFWYKRQSELNMLNRTISIMEKGETPLFVGCKRDNTLTCHVLMGHK